MSTQTIARPRPLATTRSAKKASKYAGPGSSGTAGRWMLTPFMVLYLLFLIGPLAYGIVMSFFDSSIVHSGLGKFAGFGNYSEALTDSAFWASMWHTVLFTILTTPPLVVLAFLFAVLTERIRHGRWFYRFAIFAPYVVPSAAVVLIWLWMYTPATGLVTRWSGWLSVFGLHPNYLGSADWGMIAVALLTVWWTIGFNFILYLAALQEVPRDVYDAAAVDGATGFARMWRITLPLVGRTTALVVALQIIASLKVFDQIYLLLSGGPNLSTRPALEYVYDVGFTDYRAGYAAAASLIYFVAILLASIVWLLASRLRTQEDA